MTQSGQTSQRRRVDQERSFGDAHMMMPSVARLAPIPIVDVRNDGPVRHATEGRARARALRDKCVNWLPRVAAGLLPAMDSVTRRWLLRSGSPYAAEVHAIAAELGFPGIWFLNGCYQWGCTALAREQNVPYTPDQMPKFLEGMRKAG